ncbi:hypothetical protein GGP49_003270 [Salinibacter ruber]|nr:hypothetical protein [Salinibacter ruber]
MHSHQGTSEPYGTEGGRGELSVWGGIVSARLTDYAGALETAPQAILGAVEREGIEPILDMAEPKGQGKDRDRPTDPRLRCLALTREDFGRLVEAVGDGHDEGPKRSDPGGRGRYAAVLAGPPFRGFHELGQPNGSGHRTAAAPAVPQSATAIYRSAVECPRRVPAVAGRSAPDLYTDAHRAVFRQCPPTVRECPTTGHDFGSSVRECPHVSGSTPHTLRASSTSFTVGMGPLHGRHVGGETEKIPSGQGDSPIRSIRRRPNRRGSGQRTKRLPPTRTQGVQERRFRAAERWESGVYGAKRGFLGIGPINLPYRSL